MTWKKQQSVRQLIIATVLLFLCASCSESGVEESHEAKNGATFRIQWVLDSENFPMFSLHVLDSTGTEIHSESYSHLAMGYDSGFVIQETQDQIRVYTDTKPPELLTTYHLK